MTSIFLEEDHDNKGKFVSVRCSHPHTDLRSTLMWLDHEGAQLTSQYSSSDETGIDLNINKKIMVLGFDIV